MAFNTFEPVHERVVRGLSLVSGGTAGSPIDPSDSLVIPFGLGIAVWVWRRRPVGPDRLRVRLALLAAGDGYVRYRGDKRPSTGNWRQERGCRRDGAIVASASNEEGLRNTGVGTAA